MNLSPKRSNRRGSESPTPEIDVYVWCYALTAIIDMAHIRLPDSKTAHKALKLVMNSRSGDAPHDDWNRPAGRPQTSWRSQIMRDTGLTAADAWAVADDRSTWRALRPTAGYAQH